MACSRENPAQQFLTSPEIGIPFSSCSSRPSPAIFNFPSLNVLTLLMPSSLFP
uniref:Alpha-dioxygenase 2 n=1 Tax=Rhizophora mucronata TaxID=61149 RepID=A0A2P2KGG0_RHIMU